jgi:hypothetical protein
MKDIIKDMGLDDKTFPPKYVLNIISEEKDKMVSPDQLLERAESQKDQKFLHGHKRLCAAAQKITVVAEGAAEIAALQKNRAGYFAGIVQQCHFLQSGNDHGKPPFR